MQTWEIKRVVVPLRGDIHRGENDFSGHEWHNAVWTEQSGEAWEAAQKAAANGWELVSSIPILVGHEQRDMNAGSSYTGAFYLFFKRPKPDETEAAPQPSTEPKAKAESAKDEKPPKAGKET